MKVVTDRHVRESFCLHSRLQTDYKYYGESVLAASISTSRALGWTRTINRRIRSPVLYPLSYERFE